MPLIATSVSTTTDVLSTSLFLTLNITGTTAWPEPSRYLPGTFGRPALAHSSGTLVDSLTDPVGVIVPPRWYMKWMRAAARESWGRIWFLPPGSSTLPSLDIKQNRITGETWPAAWTIFIARPENQSVQVCAWTTSSETVLVPSTGLFRASPTMSVGSCRTEVFPTFDTSQATLLESHCLGDSSCVFPTGANWFSLVNTGTTTATVVTVSNNSPVALDSLLHAPTSQGRSMWTFEW